MPVFVPVVALVDLEVAPLVVPLVPVFVPVEALVRLEVAPLVVPLVPELVPLVVPVRLEVAPLVVGVLVPVVVVGPVGVPVGVVVVRVVVRPVPLVHRPTLLLAGGAPRRRMRMSWANIEPLKLPMKATVLKP